MVGRVQDRVAVITGGCSGIGLAAARRLASEGAKIIIGDVDDRRGPDVTDKEQVDALFATAKDSYGSVDIAFNNAGISPPEDASILDTDLEAWRRSRTST